MDDVIKIAVSEQMARAIEDWVMDEIAFWPEDTAFQKELAELIEQIRDTRKDVTG